MTMPDPKAPRKPPRRFWLFAPYGLLAIAVAVWSVVWLAERAGVERRMDAAAERLRGQGYAFDWKRRRIDGYPFRLDVTLDAPRVIEPSGWGLTAPTLKAQAFAYDLDNWIVVAAQGVTLRRPSGGAVVVTGQALRASFAGFTRSPPRVSVEGVALTFTPEAGGKAFCLAYAGRLGLHLRPSGDDGAEGYVLLENAKAPDGSLLGRIAGGRPFALISDLTASKTGAFAGRDWPAMARHWAAAGGAADIVRGGMAAGPLRLGVGRGQLGLDADGALNGALTLDLDRDPFLIDNLSAAIDPLAAQAARAVIDARAQPGRPVLVDLGFQGGETTLGPVAVGPAPRLY
jgi:hypothetical protein